MIRGEPEPAARAPPRRPAGGVGQGGDDHALGRPADRRRRPAAAARLRRARGDGDGRAHAGVGARHAQLRRALRGPARRRRGERLRARRRGGARRVRGPDRPDPAGRAGRTAGRPVRSCPTSGRRDGAGELVAAAGRRRPARSRACASSTSTFDDETAARAASTTPGCSRWTARWRGPRRSGCPTADTLNPAVPVAVHRSHRMIGPKVDRRRSVAGVTGAPSRSVGDSAAPRVSASAGADGTRRRRPSVAGGRSSRGQPPSRSPSAVEATARGPRPDWRAGGQPALRPSVDRAKVAIVAAGRPRCGPARPGRWCRCGRRPGGSRGRAAGRPSPPQRCASSADIGSDAPVNSPPEAMPASMNGP